jgi:hypothetical protein
VGASDLAPNGTLVWTAAADDFGEATGPWSVRALPISGQVAGFNDGADVDPRSLAVAKTLAYWTSGGLPQSAPIP